jgi:hypothetical protein
MVDRKIAFVLGGAECVWKDLEKARKLCTPDLTIVVNDIGIEYPHPIDFWVSYHSNMLTRWAAKRDGLGLPRPREFWTGSVLNSGSPRGTRTHKNTGGSSGMLATCVAIDGNATHTILIGIPMDVNMKHFNDKNYGRAWKDGKNYLHHWTLKAPEFDGKVKSMSGWTAELLGRPTKEWLEGIDVVSV